MVLVLALAAAAAAPAVRELAADPGAAPPALMMLQPQTPRHRPLPRQAHIKALSAGGLAVVVACLLAESCDGRVVDGLGFGQIAPLCGVFLKYEGTESQINRDISSLSRKGQDKLQQ